VIAGSPARFQNFAATASDSVKAGILQRIAARDAELASLRAATSASATSTATAFPKC
jgi:hypothetical protein